MTGPQRIAFDTVFRPLYDRAASRRLETHAAAQAAPHALMQAAGLALAKLAIAIAPQAQRIWIAAGPGNNGGDGLEAALHLHRIGKQVQVTALGDPSRRPADAAASLLRAQAAGVVIEAALHPDVSCDFAIDALLGLGSTRAPEGALAEAVRCFNRQGPLRLAVDVPSGLDADLGQPFGDGVAQASHTLCLLTLKPGLFTGRGRDLAGEVWLDDLGLVRIGSPVAPRAWLGGSDAVPPVRPPRTHSQHKGSFGDLLVVGGAPGMGGAALLAARAALAAGAGRVYLSALDPASPTLDPAWPELMLRPSLWRDAKLLSHATVVCGCGGGDAVAEALPTVLARAARLVLDADALNAVARDAALQTLLLARATRGLATVLTPHPLEAARLAGAANTADIQADRLGHAERLAARFACTVLLKGSGSVVATPQQPSHINASGNARLASAGTGDVLAGWLGGLWAGAAANMPAHRVAQAALWLHGSAAEGDGLHAPLPASALLQRLGAA